MEGSYDNTSGSTVGDARTSKLPYAFKLSIDRHVQSPVPIRCLEGIGGKLKSSGSSMETRVFSAGWSIAQLLLVCFAVTAAAGALPSRRTERQAQTGQAVDTSSSVPLHT